MTRWRLRKPAAEPVPVPLPAIVQALAAKLDATARQLFGRGLALSHIDAGSCNGCELELRATTGAIYDLERLGLRFASSPRHADVLLVTGPLTRNLREALERAHDAAPDPKLVVAIGDCAIDGGVFRGSYATEGGAGQALPLDLAIPGCPPTPAQILAGLQAVLLAVSDGHAPAKPAR